MRPVSFSIVLVVVALLSGSWGCRSATVGEHSMAQTPEELLRDETPPNFTLSITVLAPPSAAFDRDTPPPRRPARYLVGADGVLRSMVRADATARAFPPETRRLVPSQVQRLWWATRDAGLLDPDRSGIVNQPELVRRDPEQTKYIIEVIALDFRRTVEVDPMEDPDTVAITRLVGLMSRLAWTDEVGSGTLQLGSP